MQKFMARWKALPPHKKLTSVLVVLLLIYSFYNSIVKVFVTPLIYHLQQDYCHDS